MICENAFYPNGTGENKEKLHCKRQEVIEDEFFKGRCPFIYWCQIDSKYENTPEMFMCIFREKE